MRFKYAHVMRGVLSFREKFLNKYSLKNYSLKRRSSRRTPVVFFGGYPKKQNIDILFRHKGLAVLVWCGSDSLRALEPKNLWFVKELKKHKNIKHIAMSSFNSVDLKKIKIPHIILPICPAEISLFDSKILGDKLYFYSSHRAGNFYGEPIVDEIKVKFPDINIIKTYASPPNNFDYSEMPALYEQTFLGLRLAKHDGLPNTVIELGLMGRKCIWNGNLPNAINWKNKQDIFDIINEEKKKNWYDRY